MNYKRNTDRLAAVTFTYVGTDQEFDEFLKMLIHDYLAVDLPYQKRTADFDIVECAAAAILFMAISKQLCYGVSCQTYPMTERRSHANLVILPPLP